MTQEWDLFIDADGRSGATNMATDQALLDDAAQLGTATLRIYRWDPPCLSFGRNDAALALYDRAKIERLGIDVVRRPTGGGAVWHEHEVTYAVAAPIDGFGSLRDAYRAIHQQLAAALRSLGADVTLAPDRLTAQPSNRLPACFSVPVGGEILAGGRKLAGSAQLRKRGAFLQHGSILMDGSQEMLTQVSRQPSDVSGATNLSTELGRPVSFDEVAEAIERTWGEPLASTALDRPGPPSTALFLDPAWTWRR